ncbi:MAG: putative DNA binding domain-containing protein [Roseburia sp.]|nr:putative DNA binding domain-containing protein [Roseburia sp.]
MTIEEILAFEEMQIFDRKSIHITPKALAIPIIAFANADGGTVAIGISDKTGRIEGVDYDVQALNELLRVPFDFCIPAVKAEIEKVGCIDFQGRENHVLLMHVEPSMEVHANQADEVFMRVGDKSRKLTFEERTQLMYDKGERFFEDQPVPEAGIEDIDLEFVKNYMAKIGYSKTPMEYLRENKGFVREWNGKEQVSSAAILLFGKNPQLYFPRARIRFIRYGGTEESVGAERNVVKDVIFEGTILQMITDVVAYLDTQVKGKTYLGRDGRFVTEEYPKFVRQEMIVNAVMHRDYSIRETDIQIKLFDGRIVVESPGKLPGLVKTDNIRHTHFSRNPKIAEFLKAYSFVKEYGEGVDRMCKELEAIGLQGPEYRVNAFMLQAIVKNDMLHEETLQVEEGSQDFVYEKPWFGEKNHGLTIEKPLFEVVDDAVEHGELTPVIAGNVKRIVETFAANQIFGRKEIKEELGYGDYKAGKAVEAMKLLSMVLPAEGKGKGKYVLNMEMAGGKRHDIEESLSDL